MCCCGSTKEKTTLLARSRISSIVCQKERSRGNGFISSAARMGILTLLAIRLPRLPNARVKEPSSTSKGGTPSMCKRKEKERSYAKQIGGAGSRRIYCALAITHEFSRRSQSTLWGPFEMTGYKDRRGRTERQGRASETPRIAATLRKGIVEKTLGQRARRHRVGAKEARAGVGQGAMEILRLALTADRADRPVGLSGP